MCQSYFCANIDNSIDLYESLVAIPCNLSMSGGESERINWAVIDFINNPPLVVEDAASGDESLGAESGE